MYTDRQLRSLVDHYQAIVHPMPLRDIDDIKTYPNDVLLSRYMPQASRVQLTLVLRQPVLLGDALSQQVPQATQLDALPPLLDSVEKSLSAYAASVRARTQHIAFTDGEALLIADVEPARYTFPSGKTIAYSLLREKYAANLSAFTAAYAEHSKIYVRENFLTLMEVLAANADPVWAFEHLAAMPIAHELAELEIIAAGCFVGTRLELELASERRSREILAAEGVPLQEYRQYHRFRAQRADHRGQSVSALVLEEIQPAD